MIYGNKSGYCLKYRMPG